MVMITMTNVININLELNLLKTLLLVFPIPGTNVTLGLCAPQSWRVHHVTNTAA